jgi:hypothetical protein
MDAKLAERLTDVPYSDNRMKLVANYLTFFFSFAHIIVTTTSELTSQDERVAPKASHRQCTMQCTPKKDLQRSSARRPL